jgi:hypothetical protein
LQDVGFVRAHASVNPGALPWSQVPAAGASRTVRFREKQAENIERVLRIPRVRAGLHPSTAAADQWKTLLRATVQSR